MPHNASTDKIDFLVGNIMMDNYISFSDDEISPNGHGSTKALHITTKVKDCTLLKVLIDNGIVPKCHAFIYPDEVASG